MTKILHLLNQNETPNLQECYDEFYSTPKKDLLARRSILNESFVNLYANLENLYQKNKHFIELLARIYYQINSKFEFKRLYDFLKTKNAISEWMEFASVCINSPLEFKSHFATLVKLYENQVISDINEEFIYLYLKNYEKNKDKSLWQNCCDKYLEPYITQTLLNLQSDDYLQVRNALLLAFDTHRNIVNHTAYSQILAETNTLYAKGLEQIKDLNFNKIIEYALQSSLMSGDFSALTHRGAKILENEQELICYMKYATMHQAKLNSSFEKLFETINIDGMNINVIDYGCGQALASCVLLDFIKAKGLKYKIAHITLIEPSSIALSRGMLHLKLLGVKQNSLKDINKGLDELASDDLKATKDEVITLHLFSNILDLENFRLNKQFYDKISLANKGKNIFVCVSPPYNNTQVRLDLFFQYFKNNHQAKCISHRNDDLACKHYARAIKRYEYIFECEL